MQLSPAPISLDIKLPHALYLWFQQIFTVFKNISFGNTTGAIGSQAKLDNMKGALWSGNTGTANTDFTVPHHLGYIPLGFLVYYQDNYGVYKKGTTAWSKTNIYLQCNTSNVNVAIFVLG